MSAGSEMVELPGSHRNRARWGRPSGEVDLDEEIEITVVLRRRTPSADVTLRRFDSREDCEAVNGADPEDVALVKAFAWEHGLSVVATSTARRTVVLRGSCDDLGNAFRVTLTRYDDPGGSYRAREGSLFVPRTLASVVVAVLGLDDRPAAVPHLFVSDASRTGITPRDGDNCYTPPEIAHLYGFPVGSNGQGGCIGIIELGGGFQEADLEAYFSALGLAVPNVTAVSVNGGQNQPGQAADCQVMLDIEVAGGVANGADVAVYFAPNNTRGFIDAVTTAIHDTTNNPSVLSIGWGMPEVTWTGQGLAAMDAAFQDAGALGITVCVASGCSDVDFPASSPNVLACGGTRLESTAGRRNSEVYWDASGRYSGNWRGGCGVSAAFPRPSYQSDADVPPADRGGSSGRRVPDVAGNADRETGYRIRVNGQHAVIGGTSAVAPMWAGLIAVLNQSLGRRAGFLNPTLYAMGSASGAFHDVASGNRAMSPRATRWDRCTGLGAPRGTELLAALVHSGPPCSEAGKAGALPETDIKVGPGSVTVQEGTVPAARMEDDRAAGKVSESHVSNIA